MRRIFCVDLPVHCAQGDLVFPPTTFDLSLDNPTHANCVDLVSYNHISTCVTRAFLCNRYTYASVSILRRIGPHGIADKPTTGLMRQATSGPSPKPPRMWPPHR